MIAIFSETRDPPVPADGLMLPPLEADTPDVFQLRFHRDFPRVLNGYLMSINVFIAVDEFTEANGGTLVVPGTHQAMEAPSATTCGRTPSRSSARQDRCSPSTRP